LAIQVAADVVDDFAHGVWLVELAALTDPALVPQTVASTLGLREEPDRPLTDTLVGFLRSRSLLMLLDNCEHLLTACARLAEALLRSCPQVRILASSREGLGIVGELTYPVRSLPVPDLRRPPAVEELVEFEGVRLFMERALFSQPAFRVTPENA